MAGVSVGLLSGPATLTMCCSCGFAPVSTLRARSEQARNVETGAHRCGPSLQRASHLSTTAAALGVVGRAAGHRSWAVGLSRRESRPVGPATEPLSPRASGRSCKPRHIRRVTELLWSVGFQTQWECPAQDFSVSASTAPRARRCRVKPATAPPRVDPSRFPRANPKGHVTGRSTRGRHKRPPHAPEPPHHRSNQRRPVDHRALPACS